MTWITQVESVADWEVELGHPGSCFSLLTTKHIFCTRSLGLFCISKIKTKTSSKCYRKKIMNHESENIRILRVAWGGCLLKVFLDTVPRQAKRKPGATILEKMLQDSPCGFLRGCSEDIFKGNSMQKSETCVCKGRGGREAVRLPTHRASLRCHQLFSSPQPQDEWKIIQRVFFLNSGLP